jgi:hypothetical protein
MGYSEVIGDWGVEIGGCVFLGWGVGSAAMKVFSLLVVMVVALFGASCERHDFEDTKKLHEKHGAAHGDEDAH